ncbi:hypothetical protein PV10_08585 [Exophiala mesophila]|uniref:Major facilitator superfamily (MFS) profile domain-containing protein n=1 Tax=Exophiala mesophila TaxID=212818 RepID=A0A0D1XLA5_EXOME|nr:uncharacterized protein PV10_08585 [Exophiala mesophila]KIV88961.1 hypothetical protein PV10_08585 [Exophiala mesophila]
MTAKTVDPAMSTNCPDETVMDTKTDIAEASVVPLMSEEEEKALVRKIDRWLLPCLWFSYTLQFLDKTTLGYAAVLGLPEGTGLVGNQYSWASSAFYYGFMVASYPASIGFIKFPIAKYLSVTMIIWAVVLTCHGAANNFVSLTVLRVLLGVFESTISPGFTLITGIWYKPSEHALRTCIWFSGNAFAAIFGGLLSYAIGHIQHSIAAWRWLFIIFGIVTFIWGIALFILLPDTPLTARFLTKAEQKFALQRPQAAQKSYKSTKWRKDQFIEALIDPKTWFLFVYNVMICLPNGGLTNFASLIIRGFGFDTFQTLLLGMPGPAISFVVLLIAAYITNKYRRMRCYVMASSLLLALVGIILVRELPYSNRGGRLVGIWLTFVFACGFPLSLSIISSNFAGYTKKTTVAAILFIGYCAGNIGGPMVFKANQAPYYESAYAAILSCFCIAIVTILGLRLYMSWENTRRDKMQGRVIDPEPKDPSNVDIASQVEGEDAVSTDLDISDWVNKSFRYCL